MRIDWWTLALQAINVLILVWLLGRFLFRPVANVIAARQASANRLLADAQMAKEEAEAEARQLKARNDGFLAEANQRRSEIEAATETERQQLLAQAASEASAILRQAHGTIDAERTSVAAEWRRSAASLAGRMAAALLVRVPPDRTTDAMLAALQARLADLGETDRHRLATDGPATIVTPAPLAEAMRTAVAHGLAGFLPGSATMTFTVDPDLIAGLELRTAHVRVRNSWRADLDAMLAALQEDDHARTG